MSLDVFLGRKFNDSHQLGILLTRYLGRDGAKQACLENGWHGVLGAICEQERIITVPD